MMFKALVNRDKFKKFIRAIPDEKKKFTINKWVIIGIMIAIVVVIAILFLSGIMPMPSSGSG